MRVNHGLRIWSGLVAGHVHRHFARRLAVPAHFAAAHVDDDQIVVGQEPLVAARACAEQEAVRSGGPRFPSNPTSRCRS